jgi:hypothetical protein
MLAKGLNAHSDQANTRAAAAATAAATRGQHTCKEPTKHKRASGLRDGGQLERQRVQGVVECHRDSTLHPQASKELIFPASGSGVRSSEQTMGWSRKKQWVKEEMSGRVKEELVKALLVKAELMTPAHD